MYQVIFFKISSMISAVISLTKKKQHKNGKKNCFIICLKDQR